MKIRRLAATLLASTVALLGTAAVPGPSADAASGPVFTVMNTSETLPDGVWFRNSPHTSDTDRVTGHGVYMNEQVQLECYAWGDAVGPYNNTLWYYTLNVTRPTNAGVSNEGYLNAHYINDGLAANQIDTGVPQCGAPPPPPPPTGGAVYYSPYGAGSHLPPASVNLQTLPFGQWAGGSTCNPSYTFSHTPTMVGGSRVSTLSGWSLGRVGPLYALEYLQAIGSPDLTAIKYVLLIDPGGYIDLSTSCDTAVGQYLSTWLAAVPDAHLVVLSGPVTLDYAHRVEGHASAGIQNFYFNPIRNLDQNGNLRSRVLVCNYTDPWETIAASHQTIFNAASGLTAAPPITSCPGLNGMKYIGSWHP